MTDTEKIKELELKISLYENSGSTNLYYALQRKMNEMSVILNNNSLISIDLDDPKSKVFDRIFKLLEKSETVSNSVKALGDVAGITGDEEKDIMMSRITTPETMANSVGEYAGQKQE